MACVSGVASVMPDDVRGQIRLGLLHPGDRGGRHQRRGGRWRNRGRARRHAGGDGPGVSQRGLRGGQLLLGADHVLLRCGDGVRRGSDRLARCGQVGTAGLHIAHGGLGVGEQLPVAIERGDVGRGVAAELLARGGEGTVGRVETLLRLGHPRLGRGHGVLRGRARAGRRGRGLALRAAARRREHVRRRPSRPRPRPTYERASVAPAFRAAASPLPPACRYADQARIRLIGVQVGVGSGPWKTPGDGADSAVRPRYE